MPNHIHVILYISSKSPSISKLIQNGKRFLVYQIVKLLQEENRTSVLQIFEDGFDSKILENKDIFLEKLNYIHKNPFQNHWQFVETPEQYKYSSASNYLLGKGEYVIDPIDFI